MITLVSVPQDGTTLDVLTARGIVAFRKIDVGLERRKQWIEGTLELAAVLVEARKQFQAHQDYSRWIEHNGWCKRLNNQDRQALQAMGKDLAAARAMLEQTTKWSWQHIWNERPNKLQRRSAQLRGTPPAHPPSPSRRTLRIPDVMQDVLPPPVQKKKSLKDHFLSREQIDPDFKGSHLEFLTKYGHIPLQTKAQIEQNQRRDALSGWLGLLADHDRTGRAMVAALAKVDSDTLTAWLAKPGKREKLQAWLKSIQSACDSLHKITH